MTYRSDVFWKHMKQYNQTVFEKKVVCFKIFGF